MPILDPSLQLSLLNQFKLKGNGHYIKTFYDSMLISSLNNADRSRKSVEALIKFKKNLPNYLLFFNKRFNCKITEEDIKKQSINNIYQFLSNKIVPDTDEEEFNSTGEYFLCIDKFQMKLFQPNIFDNESYTWFLSDTPFAILCIRNKISDDSVYYKIRFEIDLLYSAGYVLVLCAINHKGDDLEFYEELISENKFSEVHLNCNNFFQRYLEKKYYLDAYKQFKGYLYIYTRFIDQNIKKLIPDGNLIDQLSIIKKSFKQLPHIKIISFTGDNFNSAKNDNVKFFKINPFAFCKSGFGYNYLRIILSNVPLYDKKKDPNLIIPSQTSGYAIGYISPNDFLNFQKFRIEILLDDNSKITKKYINFEDIHLIRPSLYTNDQLSLAKIDAQTLGDVIGVEKKIKEKIDQRIIYKKKSAISLFKRKRLNNEFNEEKDFIQEKIWSFLKESKIKESLEYVAYAYSYSKSRQEEVFFAHRTQIYTAYEACRRFIFRKEDKKTKGVVFQVETGEGKTCIVCLIASALALLKKTVHITSSNIKLSIRDFEESFSFFKLLGIQTAVLVHSVELPLAVRRRLKHKIKEEQEEANKKENDNNKNSTNNTLFVTKANSSTINKTEKKKKVFNDNLTERKSLLETKEDNHNKDEIANNNSNDTTLSDEMDSLLENKENNHNKDEIASNNDANNNSKDTTLSDEVDSLLDTKTDNYNKDEISSNNDANDENSNDTVILDDAFSLFGSKSDSYFKLHSRETESYLDEYYDEKFYGPKLFRNSSRMNYSVCGIDDQGKYIKNSSNKAQVIFSTFVNFECFYLKMVELCPGSIQQYFSEYCLLVDEADSILIDEIGNGTIVSRSMNSNAIEILKFVYEQYMGISEDEKNSDAENPDAKNSDAKNLDAKKPKETKTYEEIYEMIQAKEEWKLFKNLITKERVQQMCEEIELVHRPEYKDGKKYSIEDIEVKKKKKMNPILKKVLNFTKDIAIDIGKELLKEFTKDPNSKEEEEEDDDDDDDDDNDDDSDDEEDDETNGKSTITLKHIVPFGYDRNGILEPNKEFGGFVQQFIAIKESIENKVENMIVNDISMSYLYISHPIFVKLYGTVCGFTGTIGSKYDKEIFRKKYKLTTLKIPRHNANLRVELPMILCQDKTERNQKIVTEVLEYHKRGNPVLVIFQDLKEIDEVEYMLNLHNIKYINIFDGKNEIVKPDEIAGIKGAISLGTNVCGRGTNIIAKGLPLHVIVSFYSSNVRVMNQAFGRTARQGQKGTCRIICIKSQYFQQINVLKNADMLLNEFSIKNQRQQDFVDHFEKNRPWIFSGFPKKQEIDGSSLQELRETKINVNRIVASNYVFPICMTKEIFLTIQEQRIFSLFNCPNCKFTWRLFQRYLRELILESWSLLINEIDNKFKDKEKGKEYDKEIVKEMNNLFDLFDKEYLPNRKEKIVPTFMFLFNQVRKKYEYDILKDFSKMANPSIIFNPNAFFCCTTGFKPYALLTDSGARITSSNIKKTNFIKDPELIFEKKTAKRKFQIISITEKIDDIFNRIFQKVNEILGTKTFLKLFLRRTMGGCEFGFCLTLDIANENEEFVKKHPFCIVDRDPLFVFTIFVRSLAPVLAIILISVLIYLASIATKIAKWFSFPLNTKELVKKTTSIIISALASNVADKIYEQIIGFIETNLMSNIDQLIRCGEEANARIIETLKDLFDSAKVENVTNRISNYLGNIFKIKSKFGKIGKFFLQPVQMMKISAYLILLLASFIMNYRCKKQRLKDYTDESKEYNDKPDEKTLKTICQRHKKDIDIDDIDDEEKIKISKEHEEQTKSYLYKMKFCNIIEKFINSPSLKIDTSELIKKGVTLLAKNVYLHNQNCIRITYSGNKKIFDQQVRFYATNQYPSIIPFVGYNIENNDQHIFLENKGNETLKEIINNKNNQLDITHKLIIAYGIACAMNYLHSNKIVHRNLKPSNIFIDSNHYPYLSNFYRAKHVETSFPYLLKSMTLRYEPPEFLTDYVNNQDSFHIDVYSYGMFLYYLITEKKPFYSFDGNRDELIEYIKKGNRPEFPKTLPKEQKMWKKLIQKCWDQIPYRRPIFGYIIDQLETGFIKDSNVDQEIFMNYKKNVLKIEDPTLTVE